MVLPIGTRIVGEIQFVFFAVSSSRDERDVFVLRFPEEALQLEIDGAFAALHHLFDGLWSEMKGITITGRSAEASAAAAGATSIDIDASLAAVEFYEANGFEEVGRGEHRLSSGRSMACVFMRKNLAATGSSTRTEPERPG